MLDMIEQSKTFEPNKKCYVSMSLVRQLFEFSKLKGTEPKLLIYESNCNPDKFDVLNKNISLDDYMKLEAAAERIFNDELMGFHLGQSIIPNTWSIIGHIMMNCKNLFFAFSKANRYSDILGNVINSNIRVAEHLIYVELTSLYEYQYVMDQCFMTVITGVVAISRKLTMQNILPVELGLKIPSAEYMNELENYFGCPIKYNQSKYYIVFKAEFFLTPIVGNNPYLEEYFEEVAEKILLSICNRNQISHKVCRILIENLSEKEININKIARTLGFSTRKLQLSLHNEGTNYKSLLQNIRESLSKKYIDEGYTIEEIALMLGFKDHSSFRKAFKKWFGYTPKEYRKKDTY